MKKGSAKFKEKGCPFCGGDLLLDYKNRSGLAKCVKCSRMIRL